MRAIEACYPALLGNSQLAVQILYSCHFEICESPGRDDHAVSGARFDHKSSRSDQHCDFGVVEAAQQIETEHVEHPRVEQK
jgi:hypothetical protein